ncbi:MAG TPA: hypothetical protein DCZ91_01890 [Lachnospiraceae bacterium]|nr:hypothetical protein [Lachnospiraceae bacterium]
MNQEVQKEKGISGYSSFETGLKVKPGWTNERAGKRMPACAGISVERGEPGMIFKTVAIGILLIIIEILKQDDDNE